MSDSILSSAEALDERIPGTLLAAGLGKPWKDLLAQIFTRRQTQDVLLIPAVPEPLIVWVLSGSAVVEERELDGDWQANRVTAGDFFLTNTPTPYELRWTAAKSAPFEVMHLYLGLPLLNRAATELYGKDFDIALRDVSGQRDRVLSALLEALRTELTAPRRPAYGSRQEVQHPRHLHPAGRGGIRALRAHFRHWLSRSDGRPERTDVLPQGLRYCRHSAVRAAGSGPRQRGRAVRAADRSALVSHQVVALSHSAGDRSDRWRKLRQSYASSLFSAANSLSESLISTAATFSSRCFNFDVPGIGNITGLRSRIHASAI